MQPSKMWPRPFSRFVGHQFKSNLPASSIYRESANGVKGFLLDSIEMDARRVKIQTFQDAHPKKAELAYCVGFHLPFTGLPALV